MTPSFRNTAALCSLTLLVALGGCHARRKTRSAPKSEDFAAKLKPIVESKHLQVLHWPDFSDYEPLVQTFYEDRNYEVAWVNTDGSAAKPSPQAAAFIQAFQGAAAKGLNPEDYDASKWPGLVQKLAGKNDDDVAQFDAAITVSVMRYISDLRIGRVNPTHFNFDIHTDDKKYDLPEFVSDNAVDATDVPMLIRSVEPDSDAYRKLEDALAHYTHLAKKQAATPDLQQPLPTAARPIVVNGAYGALAPLAERLQLEGDLATAPDAATLQTYTQPLADAVTEYQTRHSLTPDGKLTAATITSLNVPMTDRVRQIQNSLERWRWLPNEYVNAPLIVNLPEFVLHGYTDQPGEKHHLDFTMKVVVGKVLGDHDTPVFAHMMKYLIFRPYWNVPTSIIKKELTGHLQKSGIGYLSAHNFETVDKSGNPVEATAEQVEHFNVNVREKPGPKNSLGLVKFMFPNEYDIYLHSTPQPELFDRTRRDFSHGCVRVQKPADLAVWVLAHGAAEGDWAADKVNEAMQTGEDNHQVNLKTPLPIVIFYLTADYGEDGKMHFFDDIYGYDKLLESTLAKGMPYPSAQQKVNPKANAEGTE
jgi:murein L,D-transpeptidase YcbB/YkuD